MRTVGQILKEARENKLYTLEDVEKHTKIRKEMLEALEKDDFDKLPPLTFIQGFIKNYGKFLGLDAAKLLAVFRRDYEAKKHPPMVMESLKKPVGSKKFFLQPSHLIGLTVVLIVLCFFAYLWVEFRQFAGAPELVLSSPVEGQTVEIPVIIVEGQTDPDAKVKINDQNVGVDQDGKFREEIKLAGSTNEITITSTSSFGQAEQTTTEKRTVFVKK
jgi:cytoskeletal protein RodZ